MLEEIVLTADQLKCLSSPVRNDAYVRLRSLGRASAREIAEALGRPTAGIHYHLIELLKAGLIAEAFRHPAPRKPESVYEPAAKRLTLPPRASDPEVQRATREAVLVQIRRTARQFESASILADEDPVARQALEVVHQTLRLSPEDLATFKRMLREASQFAEANRAEDGVSAKWTSVMIPLAAPKAKD